MIENKTALYLITGFLGAGKTTFLQTWIPLFAGKTIRIIVNEFGRAGVDGALLRKYDAALQEIVGGSIFCLCRLDRFEATLEQVLQEKPDVVLVECSGLSDPTNAHSVLQREQDRCTYAGCICLADAQRLKKVFHTARVCKKQLAAADVIILNKLDQVSTEEAYEAKKIIYSVQPDIPILETQFGIIKTQWTEQLLHPALRNHEPQPYVADLTLRQTVLHINSAAHYKDLLYFLRMFAEDSHRIKGIVTLQEGCYQIDAVGNDIKIEATSFPPEDRLVVLFCSNMQTKAAIEQALRWYPEVARFEQ